jgi:hypothetical protein
VQEFQVYYGEIRERYGKVLYFEPQKHLNFDFNADPDPASKNNADPDPQHY